MALVNEAEIQKVRVAAEKLDKAKKDYHTAVCIAFPKGSIVRFYRGRVLIEAQVLGFSNTWWSSPRVQIRNTKTNKVYWVDAWWLLQTEKPSWMDEEA